MPQLAQISESELVLMKIIWDRGGHALYADIMDALESMGLDWKKNTVLTFLSRLVDKRMLAVHKHGRRNEYAALARECDYQAEQTAQLVKRVYGGNVRGLVNTLLQENILSDADARELQSFWEGEKKDD